MILISAQGLGRQYVGDPVFTELAFEVRAGERIGLVGPNGAGKTTLIKLLAGLEQPDYGSLFVRPGIRVSLLRQEIHFEPGETMMQVVKSGLASLIELQHELEEAAQETGRGGRRRPTASGPAGAMTSCTTSSNTRMLTRSIIASRRCCRASASSNQSFTARPRRFPAASNRG